MKEREQFGVWKSPQAAAKFRTMEDELWREAFPDPPPAFDVETRVGPTHVYHWPGEGAPVVFLHGATSTSLAWWEYVHALDGRDMYAVDMMGEVGRSEQRVALRNAEEQTDWLDETLAGMSCPPAHFVGMSYGGWLSLNLAVHKPARVASMTLLDPVGLGKIDLGRFMVWGMTCFAGSKLPGPARRKAAKWTRMPAVDDTRIMSMMLYGQRHHRVRLIKPGPLDDASLRSITAPTTVLLGANSQIHRSARIAERVRAVLPTADVEIVPGAGHALPLTHVDLAVDRIRTQLERRVSS